MDQRAPSAGIGMLPLYLANCDNLVYHDHQDYQRRGWTRVERTVFAAFNKPSIAVLEPRLGTLEPGSGKRAARLKQSSNGVPTARQNHAKHSKAILRIFARPPTFLLTRAETPTGWPWPTAQPRLP